MFLLVFADRTSQVRCDNMRCSQSRRLVGSVRYCAVPWAQRLPRTRLAWVIHSRQWMLDHPRCQSRNVPMSRVSAPNNQSIAKTPLRNSPDIAQLSRAITILLTDLYHVRPILCELKVTIKPAARGRLSVVSWQFHPSISLRWSRAQANRETAIAVICASLRTVIAPSSAPTTCIGTAHRDDVQVAYFACRT